jgi:hypothetical protein
VGGGHRRQQRHGGKCQQQYTSHRTPPRSLEGL